MATHATNEFRSGLRVMVEGEPCIMTDVEFVKPGKGQAFTRVKMRNIRTDRVWERTFKSGETLESADIQERDMEYLYEDGEFWHFMATDGSFEQLAAGEDAIGDTKKWLKEQEVYTVMLFNEAVVSVTAPNFIELEVAETDPGLKGDTAQGGSKPATLSTGAVVRVPLFIVTGEKLRIDTRTGEYVSRACSRLSFKKGAKAPFFFEEHSSMHNWQPGAALQNLQARQQLYRSIRDFFYRRGVLEVETPLLNQAPVADPNITPIQADGNRWLHTSPEYAMKRLLCAGSGDIYQICKVFRQGEAGRRHNPEFSMLEWYRVGWSLPQLMQEVAELLQLALAERYPELPVRSYSYRQALQEFAGLDVLSCSDHDIATLGRQLANADLELDRDGWLDVIMSHQVEPALPRNTLVFVDNFPASQAALAKILPQTDGAAWAQRFEVFFNGMELANGYDELLDADIQRQRFARELAGTGRPCDERLLAALEQGLPDCSGVALGLDRLLLHATGADNIRQVISFDWYSA